MNTRFLKKRALFPTFVPMNFSDFFLALSFFSCTFYLLTLSFLLYGMKRSVPARSGSCNTLVSIIVAARNEEKVIRNLLERLISQSYSNYEIIIVDDRSEDRTHDIVRSFQDKRGNLRLIRITDLDPMMPPKKRALEAGIRESKGEILLFTDADCMPPKGWVAEFASAFADDVGLVAGYSPYDMALLQGSKNTLLQRVAGAFLQFEELKGALWSAGSIGIGKAWLCTGRNLAYRKRVWEEVGGFDSIRKSVSGDDDLFLQHVRRTTQWKIKYLSTPESVVPTIPPVSLRSFAAQRIRHFSAARFFTLPMKAFFPLFHGANVVLYAGLALFFLWHFPAGILFFALKSAADILFLGLGRRFLGIGTRVSSVVVLEALYAAYNAIFAPLGMFAPYTWKGSPGNR